MLNVHHVFRGLCIAIQNKGPQSVFEVKELFKKEKQYFSYDKNQGLIIYKPLVFRPDGSFTYHLDTFFDAKKDEWILMSNENEKIFKMTDKDFSTKCVKINIKKQ